MAILLFVKKGSNALIVYASIMAGGTLLANLSIIPFMSQHIGCYVPSLKDIRDHIGPNIKLFIPLFASSIFHAMDKTMLGRIAEYNESGFYYNVDKLINIPISVLKGLGTVFLPRVTSFFKKDKMEGIKFLGQSFKLNMALSYLMTFGIIGCANEFVPIFFGEGYEPCILLTVVFTPVLLFKSVSMFYQMQYLVPTGRDKIYIIATFVGAFCNLGANAVLIPSLGALGAILGTMIAEAAVMIVQILGTQKNIPIIKWTLQTMPFCIAGCITTVVMRLAARLPLSTFWGLVIEVCAGGIVYLVLCISYWFLVERRLKSRIEHV